MTTTPIPFKYKFTLSEGQYNQILIDWSAVKTWLVEQGCCKYADWDVAFKYHMDTQINYNPLCFYFKDERIMSAFIIRWISNG